jgi:hypothetical protein
MWLLRLEAYAPSVFGNARRLASIALSILCLAAAEPAAAQSAPLSDPAGFHLLLRLENNKTTYRLGEPIQVEFACYSDQPQRYNAACAADAINSAGPLITLEVTALNSRSKIAVDDVETDWIDRAVCPYSASLGGGGLNLYPPVGGEPQWRKATITEHYPMSAGRFRVHAVTEGTVAHGPEFVAKSSAIEFKVVNDLPWRRTVIRQIMDTITKLGPDPPDTALESELEKLRYIPDLDVLEWVVSQFGYYSVAKNHPDRAQVARFLRKYLKKNNVFPYRDFGPMVHTVLALELASESPFLYGRAVAFGNVLGESPRRDLAALRAWLLPHYRELMLDLANSMAATQKHKVDYDPGQEAEALVELSVPKCADTHPFLSRVQLQRFMREAGLTQKFINKQINQMNEAILKYHSRVSVINAR